MSGDLSRSFDSCLRWMASEEWRLHSELFGGRRFALFPAFLTIALTGVVWLAVETAVAAGAVALALHALAFALGIQSGSLGFFGRDALENLIGDATLLLYAGRTLPVSNRVLFAAFVIKDIGFYAVLFFAPVAAAIGIGAGAGLAGGALSWVTVTGMFALGLAVTLCAATGITAASRGATFVGAGTVALFGVAAVASGDPVSWTPYALYDAYSAATVPSPAAAMAAVLPAVVLSGVAAALFDPVESPRSRTPSSEYGTLADLVASIGPAPAARAVAARTVLDVQRSAGGYGKLGLSTILVTAVAIYLVVMVEAAFGVTPLGMWLVAVALGMAAFTVHSTLARADSPAEYLYYPATIHDVITGKTIVFAALGTPAALAGYVAAAIVLQPSLAEAIGGAGILLGLLWYLYGVVVYLTGFQPEEHLFDVVLFTRFFAAAAVALIPLAMVGVFSPTPLSTAAAVSIVTAAGFGFVGEWLRRRAIPRWTERVHQGE